MIWIIGAGAMAIEYVRVLEDLRQEFKVIGRSAESAAEFLEKTGHEAKVGGLAAVTESAEENIPEAAIVCVNTNQLAQTTIDLLRLGVSRILVEKPGGLTLEDIEGLSQQARENSAEVYLGYNRRCYASVMHARNIIAEDGGLTSLQFEITEWGHVVGSLDKPALEHQRWFIANTTHVVDLAWHIAGLPEQISCYAAGGTDWHPSASRFTGAGITVEGSLFSYHGDWQAPGRWGLELCTPKHRLLLRPLEALQIQKLGSVAVEPVVLANQRDQDFKPGLYEQTQKFLSGDTVGLCSIAEQAEVWPIYERMAGYRTT